ncbi:MAG: glutamate synthase large subunit [Deltaproteobacteria bacterium]|nr:glutamate synthase large subunit [Deltaproteobacteria bacterium]
MKFCTPENLEQIQRDLSRKGLYRPEYEHDSCGVSFVAHTKGKKSHTIVEKAIQALVNLEHRGACGCEVNTGDGAGILIQVPHEFLAKECERLDIKLPKPGAYGVGTLFLPQTAGEREKAERILQRIIQEQQQLFLGFRDVPVDNATIGPSAREGMPAIRQFFIGMGKSKTPSDPQAFERWLFVIRKCFENAIRKSGLKDSSKIYIPSLSCRTLIYKGMLKSTQLVPFYPDLKNPAMKSALAMVHARFSTNVLPNWELAHPFRYMCHNGEINTLRGNINWMRAREALFESDIFGDEIKKILPVIREGGSDSATFDNALEMLVMGGRSLPHAVMMMIPEAWSGHENMPQEKKDFYEYHSCLMEPWDGPASIAFTDGTVIGAVLDRNGLRPSRYYVTKDDLVIMASEVGVLDVPPEDVVIKGRLQPGKMFLVDLSEGRIIDDAELKTRLVREKPYGKWLKAHLTPLEEIPPSPHLPEPDHDTVTRRQIIFGYSNEDVNLLMSPMALNGEEAIGSMGNDAPLAVLSERPQNLFNYFKQLFAQVTNPPLDAIREELVTSVDTTIGPERNLLKPEPESAHQIKLTNPVIDNDELAKLRHLAEKPFKGFRSRVIPTLFKVEDGAGGMERRLEEIFYEASLAIDEGCNIIILSDRGVDENRAPIPSLLSVAGLHHHLVRKGMRTRVGLVVESGEPREVHHFSLLIGYGAGAINPYLAFETLDDLIRSGSVNGIDHKTAVKKYVKAVRKGIVKVMSKMGVSVVQSYCGAQIFEAIGLNREVIDKYFTHTASRIEGIGLTEICREALLNHQRAYPLRLGGRPLLEWGGQYQWRSDGEYHLFNPDTVAKLQYATKAGSTKDFKEYSKLVNDQSRNLCTLRGLFEFKKSPGGRHSPIPIEEVEPAKEIVKRFKTGAMSYGSISQEAHETLAVAMNRIGGKSNTGEGGEDPARYLPQPNGDSKNSAIKQVASARFGVTSEYLAQAKELQIKIAQGAKPGEGGQLPGPKVYPWIAKVRYSTPYVGLISPPPHHDIYSIEDLAQLIFDLKNSNPQARVSVKLVAEVGVGTVAAGVAKAHADVVLIAGYDGGTGASPLTSIKHAGVPWELGMAETQQVLVMNKLRDRIVVEVDGQLKTGRDVAIAALLGGEEFGFSTAPLVAMGCIMMRVCHLNTCPVGVATQDPELRKKFTGQPEHVINYFFFVAEELREIMAGLGFRTVDEMIGRSDRLDFNKAIAHWKARGLDFSPVFYRPEMGPDVATRCIRPQDHGLEAVLDNKLIERARPALEKKQPVQIELPIRNIDRAVGAMLGYTLTKKYGGKGLPDDTIQITFNGSAGQSFGAFIPKGMTFTLIGDANDYFGKGLSGGKIFVYPPGESPFVPEKNIIIGNVAFYGATSGCAYIRGVAGERFCVRNSGVHAVVEGVGDHACEYMTGGRVLVLGKTGRNFGAGMSGGIAFVHDPDNEFEKNCNLSMVELQAVNEDEDIELIKRLLQNHFKFTGSTVAKRIFDNFNRELAHFVKVMPIDYKKALVEIRRKMKEQGISEEQAMYG